MVCILQGRLRLLKLWYLKAGDCSLKDGGGESDDGVRCEVVCRCRCGMSE